MLLYITRHAPRVIMIENVEELLHYRDQLTEDFKFLNYNLTLHPVDPSHFGEPVSRARVWGIALPMSFCSLEAIHMHTHTHPHTRAFTYWCS